MNPRPAKIFEKASFNARETKHKKIQKSIDKNRHCFNIRLCQSLKEYENDGFFIKNHVLIVVI